MATLLHLVLAPAFVRSSVPPPPPTAPTAPPLAPSALTYRLRSNSANWAWDLSNVRFYSYSEGAQVQAVPVTAIESGSNNSCVSCSYGADRAIFHDNQIWGGRRNTAGEMWIGATWQSPPNVAATSFVQTDDTHSVPVGGP
eukprot:5373149-Prymnesium_polylepis.1